MSSLRDKAVSIREKMKRGQPSFGSWLATAHVSNAEILAAAGFDWVAIDMEHSSIVLSDLPMLFGALERGECVPLVRLPENDPSTARRVMDLGACGIIIPMVNSQADAEKAALSVRYPPIGQRGVGIARAQEYGRGFKEYVKATDDAVLVIPQIEHIRAVENVEAIFSVRGVDAYMIGPYDLSGSLGIPGQLRDPRVESAKAKVLEASRGRSIIPGIHLVHPNEGDLADAVGAGYRFIALSSDILMLADASDRIASLTERHRGRDG
ncbi:MAG: 2,4-dihydroxyhept-2-ene-1,7-dioic acid aldolase [Verrucomicrobiae bacterium]|nr:2,4-dihydroxyhept-2-ene-1,7-dioic acid aldolase [Verrucomicrobiae bacterium]